MDISFLTEKVYASSRLLRFKISGYTAASIVNQHLNLCTRYNVLMGARARARVCVRGCMCI